MELKLGLLFETFNGCKYELTELNNEHEFVILTALTKEGKIDKKRIKYPFHTFHGFIKNKTFSKTLDRKRSNDADIYEAQTDSDINLRDISKK